MNELSKVAQATVDLVAARDERDRLFQRLRNPHLDDAARTLAVEDFAKAETAYRDQLANVTKKKGA